MCAFIYLKIAVWSTSGKLSESGINNFCPMFGKLSVKFGP